jgi:hypothetical protein
MSAAGSGFVIPAKAGIQSVIFLLDTRLRGCDGKGNGRAKPRLDAEEFTQARSFF